MENTTIQGTTICLVGSKAILRTSKVLRHLAGDQEIVEISKLSLYSPFAISIVPMIKGQHIHRPAELIDILPLHQIKQARSFLINSSQFQIPEAQPNYNSLFLWLITLVALRAALPSSFSGLGIAWLEASAGGLTTLGGNISLSRISRRLHEHVGFFGIYLLIGIHATESALVTGLAALAGDVLNLLLGTVGEVSGVRVGSHVDRCSGSQYLSFDSRVDDGDVENTCRGD